MYSLYLGMQGYIILRTDEEKEYAFDYARKIVDNLDAEKYLNVPMPYLKH